MGKQPAFDSLANAINAGNMANAIEREKEITRLREALMTAIKAKEDAENGAWTCQQVYERAINEVLPSGFREVLYQAILENAAARPTIPPNPYKRLVAALRMAIDKSRKAENLAWECGTETEDGVATILEDSRGDAWRELSDARSDARALLRELGEL